VSGPSQDTLNAQFVRPAEGAVFWTPQLASRWSPCLELKACAHARCAFLRLVALACCRLCGHRLGWGAKVKSDPQRTLFGSAWVHTDCDATRVGRALLREAATGRGYTRRIP
jgi:hypothetical protein